MLQPLARFDALFALALHVHGTPEGTALSWDEVAARIHERVRQEQNLSSEGLAPADLTDARFAAYAFVDEILFRSPRQGEVSGLGWSANALQNRYFGTNDGGELFFGRLADVLTRLEQGHQTQEPLASGMPLIAATPNLNNDLATRFRAACTQEAQHNSTHVALSVFAQCLAWGFRGKLYSHEEQIRELREAACAMLCAEFAPLPMVAASPASSKSTKAHFAFLTDCEPLLHILLPLTICAAWYALCADIITRAVRF